MHRHARSKSVVYSRSNSGKGRGKYRRDSRRSNGSVAASITSYYSSDDNHGPEKQSNG